MANVVDCTYEEKLRILAALDVKERLERVIEVLQRQIQGIQGSTRITVTSSTAPSGPFDIDRLRKLQQEALLRRGTNGLPGGMPPGFLGFPGGNQGGDRKSVV